MAGPAWDSSKCSHCHRPLDPKLANIPTRGFVDTGNHVMIGPACQYAGLAIEISTFPRNLAEDFG
jgi:hypothetical protein